MTGHSHTEAEGTPFALEVMQHMNDKCTEWKEASNIDFSLYGTPLESTTYKFAKCLQRRFGTRRLAVIGGVMYSLAWICMGQADTLPMLYFSFSLLGGGGAGLVYNSSVAVATKSVPDKKGFANGLCIGGHGVDPVGRSRRWATTWWRLSTWERR